MQGLARAITRRLGATAVLATFMALSGVIASTTCLAIECEGETRLDAWHSRRHVIDVTNVEEMSPVPSLVRTIIAAAAIPLVAAPGLAQSPFDSLHFRSIGPAATGGRVHDIEVDPRDPSTIYIGSATGGIWKTTNKGTIWSPIFDGQADNSFGDLSICAADTRVIWAGTGEQNNRQSSSWGGGVYRSTDAGRTWTFLGLRDTRSIGRVRAHPGDCNTAFVAAVGNLWAPSADRGVYKTTDGGRTWLKVLGVDTLTGATELVMDPRDPNTLYAATYQRLRSAFGFNGGGPGSAIYKTTDAGASWTKAEQGLPAGDKGRIGLAIAPSNSRVLIATIEHATESGVYRSDDAGATWRRTSRVNPRPMYYSKPVIDPTTDQRIWLLGTLIVRSEDGGVTFAGQPTSATYDVGLKTDHHTLWIDPRDTRHLLLGGDGGLNESWDLGETYTRLNDIPIGQFYRIAVDDRDPYWIYGGLQDNHSWMGPSATRHWLGILNRDWVQIGFSDGTGQAVDRSGYRTVYSTSSGGSITRVDPETGDRRDLDPVPPRGDSAYRFDWDAPVLASRHTAGTVYLGGNRLFISRDRGTTWQPTKDLTRMVNRDTIPLMGRRGREIRLSRNDGESSFSEITAVAESPLDARVLWVGTDDGNIQVSRDGGATWREVSAGANSAAGVPSGTFVGRVLASGSARGTAYATFDAHRAGNFAPYIVRTTDFGATWSPVVAGLPDGAPVRSIAEYPGVPRVLFAGTERHLYVSRDGGGQWSPLRANLPTTRYDDIVIHPRTRDLVLGTHGRSLWILDDASPIAAWTDAVAAERAHLFAVPRATLMLNWEDVSNMAQGLYAGENPADGASFTYHLSRPADSVTLVVRGADRAVIRTLKASGSAGVIHRVAWDLRHEPPPAVPDARGGGEEGGEGGGGGAGAPGADSAGRRPPPKPVDLPVPPHDIGPRGPSVAPGQYTVTLVAGSDSVTQRFEVRGDPESTITIADQRARERFLMDVQAAQVRLEKVVADLRTRRAGASGADSTRLVALERRLTAGRTAVRSRLGGVARAFNGQGALQGSFAAPTSAHRRTLADATAALVEAETGLGVTTPR